jgi:hypothetical protein
MLARSTIPESVNVLKNMVWTNEKAPGITSRTNTTTSQPPFDTTIATHNKKRKLQKTGNAPYDFASTQTSCGTTKLDKEKKSAKRRRSSGPNALRNDNANNLELGEIYPKNTSCQLIFHLSSIWTSLVDVVLSLCNIWY